MWTRNLAHGPCKLVCLTGGGRSLLDEAHLMLHEGIPIRDGKIVT
jgi:hypothetical protein